ncbi:hypothetical protein [Nocardia aurantia]|uniref:Uncharacterized protein n=1 Tax=Nocardia aurantia TaxID=2585199 RepID=A0A7K0DYN2_9NOCA|nr:hypothetical protein [Nocardia aurantia]MQY30825.1 hypothetical protein [Nocardia aurantia]
MRDTADIIEAPPATLGTRTGFRTIGLRILFAAGVAACVGSGFVLPDQYQHAATYAGTAVSLLTGPLVMREEPLRSWLAARPTLWFLFVFNLAVAVCAGVFLDGPEGIAAAAGMGVVSLGAGIGLLRTRPAAAPAR